MRRLIDNPHLDDITLEGEELEQVKAKRTPKNQLAFAVMLKFFQLEGYHPANQESVSDAIINRVSTQLDLSPGELENFDWKSITAKRFRQEIRELFGYKKATVADSERLIQWLMEEVLTQAPTLPQCYSQIYKFFRENRLEPFAKDELERYVRSAITRFENGYFSKIFNNLSPETIKSIDNLLSHTTDDASDCVPEEDINSIAIKLMHLKRGVSGVKLKHVNFEIEKLRHIRSICLPMPVFHGISRKLVQKYYLRIMAAAPSNIADYVTETKYASMASFCYIRSQILTDNLADLFIKLTQKMRSSAKTNVNKNIVSEVKRVDGKFDILYRLADTATAHPDGIIKDKIYPKVSQETLRDLLKDLQHQGKWYQKQVNTKVRSLYAHAHRKVLLALLDAFTFNTNNTEGQALLDAITFIKQNQSVTDTYYPEADLVPKEVIPSHWKSMTIDKGHGVNRFNYEVAVLEELHKHLYYKSIWIEGAYRYRNPHEDLPGDWETRREHYYQLLGLPIKFSDFAKSLKENLHTNLKSLNDSILSNEKVKILTKNEGHIKLSPSEPQVEPKHLKELQREINRRWSTINLIDILKETDFRIDFTQQFNTVANREIFDREQLRKRLLLCLYAIGSNTGLKRISAANDDSSHSDLRYVKRRYIHEANVKAAIIDVVNEILVIRDPKIWKESTTGCACDSTQVSCWDQNLLSEWHPRYKDQGVMIYWHVDRNSTVIHSQLKTCLSSEVGAMITGVLRHDTKMNMDKTYVDTHGQSTVGFAFSHGLKFSLLPRLKNLHKQKLYYPSTSQKDAYPNLGPILKKHINWNCIEENYDEYVKHLAALKTGTVEADVLIKKFSHDNYNHPVYKALIEIGNAVKTIFLCRYLASEELRIEIHESLNVVERLNGIMGFIFYGKLGEISSNKTDDQSLSVACLHLLQVCMVYINTLIIQEVLSDPVWSDKFTPEDKRALSPLIHAHINPYGLFPLDLYQRLIIETDHQEDTNYDRNRTYARETESEAIS
jgi:TnpA family transposase